MAARKCDEDHMNILVENLEKALVYGIDEFRRDFGMSNRSDAVAFLLWQGLQHRGETKAGIREAYAESVAAERRP